MKAILDIPDNRAPFMLELLSNFPFVKVQTVSEEKELLMSEIREAVENVNRVKKGSLRARPAKALLDEI